MRKKRQLTRKRAAVYELAGKLRNLKAEYNLAASKDVKFIAKKATDWLTEEAEIVSLLVVRAITHGGRGL